MYKFTDSAFWNTIIYLLILAIIIISLVYIVDKFMKMRPYFFKILNILYLNLYLFLLPFPIFYLMYYNYYYIKPQSVGDNIPLLKQPEIAEYLKDLSVIFFSGGVFSATVKLINSLVIFKKNFQKMILSDDFDNLLKDKFQILALSDDFLLKRNDLQDIWTRVTTCKYQQKFPELKDSIVTKLENDFFVEKMLTYYYHNFRIQVNFKLLDNDIVEITEISSFKVVSNSTLPIEVEFKITSDTEDNKEIYTKLIEEDCKLDNKKLELIKTAIPTNSSKHVKSFKAILRGNKDYTIERKVEMTQNLNDDRVFSFSSSIIIDNMTVNLIFCDNLNLFFSVVGKNKFEKDNQISTGSSYISRDVILPGEKFKVFIYKKK